MRAPRYFPLGVLGAVAGVLGACSLLTPLSGYSNGAPDPTDAAPASDAEAAADAEGGGGLTDAPTPAAKLYVFGGSTPDNSDLPLASVLAATIQPDGSLGSWASATPLPAPRRYAQAATDGALVALLGGEGGGARYDSTAIGTITGGDVAAWSTSGVLFATPRIRHAVAFHEGRSYLVGGSDAADVALVDVQISTLSATGLGPFTTGPSLPSGRTRLAAVAGATSLYVVGGTDAATVYMDDIFASRFQSGGALSAFTAQTSLPTARGYVRAIVYGTSLVVVGGETAAGPMDDVVVFPIAPTGDLGAARASTPLPRALSHHSMVQYANRLYVVGGLDSMGQADEVFVGDLAADGSVTAWRSATKLPAPRTYHTMAVF